MASGKQTYAEFAYLSTVSVQAGEYGGGIIGAVNRRLSVRPRIVTRRGGRTVEPGAGVEPATY
jgi:hypothetical protein